MIKLNTIYNEDCLVTMGRMSNDFVDLTVTSPPAVAFPDQVHGATRFSVCVNFNGKEYLSETSVQNGALAHEGYIDFFFRQFITKFKEGVGAQLKNEESQAQHTTGPAAQ